MVSSVLSIRYRCADDILCGIEFAGPAHLIRTYVRVCHHIARTMGDMRDRGLLIFFSGFVGLCGDVYGYSSAQPYTRISLRFDKGEMFVVGGITIIGIGT